MRKETISVLVLAAFAGLANAELVHWTQLTGDQEAYTVDPALGTLTIDISGYASYDLQGDSDNEILSVFMGPPGPIWAYEFGWNLNLTTVGVSWADESTLTFNDTLSLSPAAGDAFSVTNMNYQGTLDPLLLGDVDLSGFMHIEFHEIGFDDNPDEIDSYFEAGSYLYFVFPSPGTLGVAACGGLLMGRRRRLGD
ncbi:MAG: hypothetical protein ACF8MF_03115 [Phycisphaerales bacterium JB052]